jgi:hypothetical protein
MNAEMEAGRLVATPFVPRDPAGIPPRAWLYGRHLIRRNVSVTVAPGGVGKSSLTIIQALELVTGRQFLGDWNAGPLRVWLFNLEDERSELVQRQQPWPVATTNLSGGSDWRTGLPVWRSGSPDKDLFLV